MTTQVYDSHATSPGDSAQSSAPGRKIEVSTWQQYYAIAERIDGQFARSFSIRHFDYLHPLRLQKNRPLRFRKCYPVKVSYTDWGAPDLPILVCCGGVANSARRFSYLAADLKDRFRVICMDWVGRGQSGWMDRELDYTHETYVEQLRQLLAHLGDRPVHLLGSSLGGSVAIDFCARFPHLVNKLILNDIGPFIPHRRRARRAETLVRFYVFREPAELLRRIGASQKNDGPIPDSVRFYITYHQTRWSEQDGGRIYRHDMRAMQAFQTQARTSLNQWSLWQQVRCPVLLLHGLSSDALSEATIARMARSRSFDLIHVPNTGHTPVLSDRNQTWCIRTWLGDEELVQGALTVLPAAPRQPRTGEARQDHRIAVGQ
ncbi:MAG: alpha/beta hydrolase [Pseudomonadota bacterium]|nr:alpha/beta hydrolase [Pseudomonadota bacterium]